MRLPNLLIRPVAALSLLALGACGGDDGPSGPSANFSIAGSWDLSVTEAKTGTTTCAISGDVVTFVDTNGTISGSVAASSGAEVSCVINGQTQTQARSGTGSLSSASLNGSTVSFGFSSTSGPSTMTGTVQNDDRMGGTATITLSFSGTPKTPVGKWSATRR